MMTLVQAQEVLNEDENNAVSALAELLSHGNWQKREAFAVCLSEAAADYEQEVETLYPMPGEEKREGEEKLERMGRVMTAILGSEV